MTEAHVWTIEVTFDESSSHTRADAYLDAGRERYHGWGRARRNPTDPDRPLIGREIAAARSLEDLVGQLKLAAEDDIELIEGHDIQIHL